MVDDGDTDGDTVGVDDGDTVGDGVTVGVGEGVDGHLSSMLGTVTLPLSVTLDSTSEFCETSSTSIMHEPGVSSVPGRNTPSFSKVVVIVFATGGLVRVPEALPWWAT